MKRSLHAALPSIDSLLVFEQAARFESFTKAGAHLGLTQSAVSRQMIDLEALLQTSLFVRERQRLKLSAAGREFSELVQPVIQGLRAATLRMQMSEAQSSVINISVAASLCNLWFIPNLPAYHAEHEGAQVNVMPHVGLVNFASGLFDAAIVNAETAPENCEFIKLYDIAVAPFAAPSLLKRLGAKELADLDAIPAVELRETNRGWPRYLEHTGLTHIPLNYVGSHSLFLLSYEAGVAGLGIPLLPEFVSSNALVRLHDAAMPLPRAYYFCWQRSGRKSAAIQALAAWLQQRMAQTLARA